MSTKLTPIINTVFGVKTIHLQEGEDTCRYLLTWDDAHEELTLTHAS